MSGYRYPAPPGSPRAVAWDELESGMQLAVMEVPNRGNGRKPPAAREIYRLTVERGPHPYRAQSPAKAAYADGTPVVLLRYDDGRVVPFTRRQLGFGPLSREGSRTVHGDRYCARVN